MAEADLVRRLQAGDEDWQAAWREFDRRYAGKMLGFIRVVARDMGVDACNDLLQTASVLIYRKIGTFTHRGDGSLLSWCLKIAQRVCLSARRVPAGHPPPEDILSFEELQETLRDDGLLVEPRAGDEDEQTAGESAEVRALRRALAGLTPVDQAVITLRHLVPEPVPDEEIARQVGKPKGQIRQIRFKALEKLKRAVQRELHRAVAGRQRRQ